MHELSFSFEPLASVLRMAKPLKLSSQRAQSAFGKLPSSAGSPPKRGKADHWLVRRLKPPPLQSGQHMRSKVTRAAIRC